MSQVIFSERIRKELRKLSREQIVTFAWRCAMHALPFLGSNGNFNFWDEKNRQRQIYAIFHSLDVNVAYRINAIHAADIFKITSSAYTANTTTSAHAAATAVYAAYAVTYHVYANFPINVGTVAGVDLVAHSAIYPATNSAYAANQAAFKSNMNLESVILRSLKRSVGQHISTEFYGELWDNFQKVLEAEGCGYWGKLYKNIFDNNFELDQTALERRMNVPEEIREQGAAVVANYLEELEKGATRLNEARIIILGDKGAGKTCLARRLIDPDAPMTIDDESTAGVDTTLWKLEDENINVSIWDFAGHTVTHAVHQFFLSERCLYIMVYNGRTEENNRLEYWLNHMKNYGGDSKAIILVNKRDQHSVNIPINSLKEQYPIADIYTFSIQDDKADLLTFRIDVAAYIENNPSWEKQEIPTNYFQVKEELEQIFDKNNKEKAREHITREEFNDIAGRHNVGNIEDLLISLRCLGVSLWYEKMEEFNTLILNPEWISHGVYKIINWVNEEKKYSLTLDDFVKVFSEDGNRYPTDKHEFLFNLMKHYELAYETSNGKNLIIPHLLNKDRPAILPVFQVGDSLMIRYEAEQPLPPNTISRFIVRHNQEIKKENSNYLVWRYGVVLEDGNGSIALVREDDRTISVSVRGNEETEFISSLRKTLNDIFNSYKSDKPKLKYRVKRFGEIPDDIEEKNPLWLADRNIINHHQREKEYYDDVTDQSIPMPDVVEKYNINADTVILGGQGHQVTNNTFNFKDCNIDLQSNLNELAGLLTDGGNKEEAAELENAAKALEQAEACKSKVEVKKKGIGNRLKRVALDLEDENSKLHKSVKGIKHGIGIAQDIAKGYNDIAQWAGLPQVPTPFLKKK